MAKKENYEDMLLKLQDVLNILEEQDINLEESMKAYEDGIKLVNKLYKTLNALEGKISIVKGAEEVEFIEEDENR